MRPHDAAPMFRYATLLERQAEYFYDAIGRNLGIPFRYAFNLPDCAMDSHDNGDEDDVHIPNAPHKSTKAEMRQPWARIHMRWGVTRILYPAVELPPMENHDDGDAEPRLERRFWHAYV